MKFNNQFGKNFPTENTQLMIEALSIQANDRVLDVGGGGAPFERANVIVDYDLHNGIHRDKLAPPVDERWIAADIHALPFADNSFDFVYCTHVLEHVSDPALACRELMRVAKRGYIETPEKFTELVHGHPTHRWLIQWQNKQLVFQPRCFIESPLQNFVLAHVLNYPKALDNYLTQYRNLSCVQLCWDESFDYDVKTPKQSEIPFNYEDNKQAIWSHYYFALNLLANHAPVDYCIPHIETALALSKQNNKVTIKEANEYLKIEELLASACLIANDIQRANSLFVKLIQSIQETNDNERLLSNKNSIQTNLENLQSGNILSVVLPENKGLYLLEQTSNIEKLEGKNIQIAQEKSLVEEKKQQLEEKIKQLEQQNTQLHQSLDEISTSTSWKITKPLRQFKTIFFSK